MGIITFKKKVASCSECQYLITKNEMGVILYSCLKAKKAVFFYANGSLEQSKYNPDRFDALILYCPFKN